MLVANLPGEWLTSFWLLSIGAGLGLVLVLLTVALFLIGGKLGLSRLVEGQMAGTGGGAVGGRSAQGRSTGFYALGGIVALLVLAAGLALWNWFAVPAGAVQRSDSQWLLAFLLLVPLSVFVGFGVAAMFQNRAQEQLLEWLGEGVSFWLLVIVSILSAFAVFGIVGQQLPMVRFVGQPIAMLNSVWRLPLTGTQPPIKFTINPALEADEGAAVPVRFYGNELKRIGFQSTERLEFATDPITPESDREKILELAGSTETNYFSTADVEGKLPKTFVENFYIRNLSDRPSELTITLETQPQFPQVKSIFVTMLATWAVFMGLFFQTALLPKESAIAWSTFKTETSQPLFGILMAVGMVFLTIALYIPYNTFGEDIKMYVTTGRPVILLLSIFFAVWASSKSVAEEIEGRTALTVLAKPLSRRQFLIGKALGIGWAVGLLFLCIGLWFLFLISYKTIYDGIEASKGTLPWQDGYAEMVKFVPALVLGYMETMVFVFISVMISTRLAVVSNLMICFSIYMLGHITPMLLEKENTFESVTVVGQAITTVIPVLEHFDVSAAIVGDATVPAAYLGWALVYSSLYCTVAMLIALILFEDRDLS
jgi:ABC-type transport system involved in multi-copper enzyme maturation permease subunit